MPGTLSIRPIEARLTHNTRILGSMDTYYQVLMGYQSFRSKLCLKGGKNPHWDSVVTLKKSDENVLYIELKDHRTATTDKTIGVCQVDLDNVRENEKLEWYPLYFEEKPAGELLVNMVFSPDESEKSNEKSEPQKEELSKVKEGCSIPKDKYV